MNKKGAVTTKGYQSEGPPEELIDVNLAVRDTGRGKYEITAPIYRKEGKKEKERFRLMLAEGKICPAKQIEELQNKISRSLKKGSPNFYFREIKEESEMPV